MPIPNVNQITTTLRGMPDQQLQQYAAIHKNDPYILSLAIQESNGRQQLRTAAMAKMAGQQPPTVAEQDIAKMAQPVMPPQMPQGMPQQMPQGGAAPGPQAAPIPQAPQDQGLPSLPAQNLQSMAEGGIAGYAGGGAGRGEGDAIDAYRQYAIAKARQMGLSPYLADSIFRIESGYNPNARSKTGPVGIGQLTKATGQAYGVDPDERTDPYKNIDASIAYMSDLQKKYGGDSAKMAVAYNQGEGVLNKHLRDNNGQINPSTLPNEAQGYLKKFSKLLTAVMPGSNAQAAELPSAAPAQPAAAPAETPPTSAVGKAFGNAASTVGTAFSNAGKGIADLLNPTTAGYAGEAGISPELAQAVTQQRADASQAAQVGGYDTSAGADWENINPSAGFASYKPKPAEDALGAFDTSASADYENENPEAGSASGIAALTAPETKKEEGGFHMSNEDMFNMGMALLAGKSQYALQNLGEAGISMAQLRNQRQKQAAEISHLNATARQANAMADIAPERAALFDARAAELANRVPAAQKQQFNVLQAQAKGEQAAAALLAKTNPLDPQVAIHQANAARLLQQMTSMAGTSTMAAAAPTGTVPLPAGVTVNKIGS